MSDTLDQLAAAFAELPRDCGNRRDPGLIDTPDLRDWSRFEATPDQRRMERFIDRYDLSQRRVLHVGIGNSGLARRFAHRTREVVGITVDQPEIDRAHALALRHYRVALRNKYSDEALAGLGTFDFILDNNLTSSCCCLFHLDRLLAAYARALAPGGQIVTDRVGLAWVPPLEGRERGWSFTADDLALAARAHGLSLRTRGRLVLTLARGEAAEPAPRDRAMHALRRLVGLPREAGQWALDRAYEAVQPLIRRLRGR